MLIKPPYIYPLIECDWEEHKFVDLIFKIPQYSINITLITIKIMKSSLQKFF